MYNLSQLIPSDELAKLRQLGNDLREARLETLRNVNAEKRYIVFKDK